MFCSNQELLLCGDKQDNKALEKSISLICDGFCFRPRSYAVKEDGCLYFYQYNPDKMDGVIEICDEDKTVDFNLSIIRLYFSSFKYKDALSKTYNEYRGADGSSKDGWEIVLDNKSFGNKLVIKPYWCFYHK